jgi:DNA-binding NarL/FixJ family response regulator
MIRITIADDHAIVRSGLKQIFALMPELVVVAEAVNGAEVLRSLQGDAYDLLLLDLNMEGISSFELIARVRSQRPQLPILVLSMHDEPQVAARALKAGASGYVTKDCEPEVLLEAIRKVAGGGRYVAAELAQNMVFEASAMAPHALHSLLSDRELQVFQLLLAGKGVNDIAALLSISNKTVSTHKLRLMEKLRVESVAELMRYAMEHGLVI